MLMNMLASVGMVDLCDYETASRRDPWAGETKFREPANAKAAPEGWPAGETKFKGPPALTPVGEVEEVKDFLESLIQEFDEFVGRYGTAPNALLIHRDYDAGLKHALVHAEADSIPVDLLSASMSVLNGMRVIFTEERAWQLAFLDGKVRQ